jgi:hypothetical protein
VGARTSAVDARIASGRAGELGRVQEDETGQGDPGFEDTGVAVELPSQLVLDASKTRSTLL